MEEKLAVAIDLGGTNLKGAIVTESGKYRHLTRVRTHEHENDKCVLDKILDMIDSLIKSEGSKEHIVGVGIGTPGFVDLNGVVSSAENVPGWSGTQIYDPIKKRFDLRATAANDVTAAACAEWKYGAGKGVANMVCFALGTGIGGGMVLDNKLYKGTHGMAGELGHISVETDGFLCKCGQHGCVEQYASGRGIVNVAKRVVNETPAGEATPFVEFVKSNPPDLGAKSIYRRYIEVENPDPVALKVHDMVCDMLSRVIGISLNTFAPDKVVIGGGVMKSEKVMLEGISKFVPRYCWPAILEHCEIVSAALGEDAGVIGAGAMAFEELTVC
ncbi:MAG: ROK family protein [Fibrobacter sp.]|nr:ROK family protein [Fibrobacter sp.]